MDHLSVYAKRNRVLRELGFADYAEYRASDLWRKIRRDVLRGKRECVACPKRATQVHHRDYDKATLQGRRLDSLWPVCKDCHEAAELKGGVKTSLQRANAKLAKAARRKKELAGQKPAERRTRKAKAPPQAKPEPAGIDSAQRARDLARLAAMKARKVGRRSKKARREATLRISQQRGRLGPCLTALSARRAAVGRAPRPPC